MKAIQKGTVTVPENRWHHFISNNLAWMLESDGWTLIEEYIPPEDPETMTAAEHAEEQRHVL